MTLTEYVDGIVHEATQCHDDGEAFDLTAAEVYEVTEPGRVDFGGEPNEVRRTPSDRRSDGSGELTAASLTPHDRVWRDEDDDYQWWHLDAGQYVVAFNETVDADRRLLVQPRDAILERGASHPTLHVSSIGRVPLSVGGAGLRLKENARVSTLLAP